VEDHEAKESIKKLIDYAQNHGDHPKTPETEIENKTTNERGLQ
jgi:hypothetical protein